MGRKLYTIRDISKTKTAWLGIPNLMVLEGSGDDAYLEVVHRRYFEGEKMPCPACQSIRTRCSKIVERKLKDLIWLDEDHTRFQIIDLLLHQRYVFCSYLAKLLPSDPVQPFDLDNRVKLEYYRLEKTYEGAIELESKPGSWKPTHPKRAGGQKDRTSPLDEIIQRINEEFYGEFTDADRVMVDTLYQKMRKDAKTKKAAKTDDRQVYERSIFPGIFDTTAQEAYIENTEAYEQLFLDADKYQAVMRALADRLYRELHDGN